VSEGRTDVNYGRFHFRAAMEMRLKAAKTTRAQPDAATRRGIGIRDSRHLEQSLAASAAAPEHRPEQPERRS
jgi:hypothetical protein